MKIKRLLTGFLATAVAVSAMATTAFAAGITSSLEADNYNDGVVILIGEDEDTQEEIGLFLGTDNKITDVYGYRVTTTIDADQWADEEFWIGGGIGWNSESTGWDSEEWGRNDAKPIPFNEDGVIERLSDQPVFAADDTYAQLWVQAWGGDLDITKVEVLGKDGAVIVALGGDTDDADDTNDADDADDTNDADDADDADDTDKPADDSKDGDGKGSPSTGVEDVVAVSAIALLATGAIIFSRKRK